ncbi:hypothetical protein ABZV77_25945 [Streptomyces sp. NPDC004732]|uniref:hypothetical protein n=1 Tax=Streptomyces sp. NPDC004732 TaxID=3154290 RepID=UPI0033B791A0
MMIVVAVPCLRSRAMQRSLGKRIGVVAAAVTTAVLFSASPAFALEDIEIKDPARLGVMWFHDDGDTFNVCDTRADGSGVKGKLFYKPIGGDWYVVNSATDGGDANCGKFANDVNNVGDYQMKLYTLSIGKEIAKSRVFNE